jgi:hypothetical protein
MSAKRSKPQLGLVEPVIPGKEGSFSEIQEPILTTDVLVEVTVLEAEEFLEISAEVIYRRLR